METVQFQWLQESSSLKEALQDLLGCSGQLLKRHFSSKELSRAVRVKDLHTFPLDFINHLAINPLFEGPQPEILRETKDFLVLHKPGNLHCHPLCYSDKDTLLNFLAMSGKSDALLINRDHYDRGLLYRLDYETSGVMVLAKTNELVESFRNNFGRMKRKFYWAVVDGSFDKEGKWTHFFRATGMKGHKQVVSDFEKPDSQSGTLEVKKILEQNGKSLLLVKLQTGLRHQIRAQLAHLGFPILGDELYGGKKAERLFLHALRYEWEEAAEDPRADLFESFFDLDRALQVSHDVIRIL